MPVRTVENTTARISPRTRWALVAVLVPVVVVASLVEYVALWSAATGYWGPEWPTVERDAWLVTAVWLSLVAALVLTVLRPMRLAWRRRGRRAVSDRR